MSHKKAHGEGIPNEEFQILKGDFGQDPRVEMRDHVTLRQAWCTSLMRQSTA